MHQSMMFAVLLLAAVVHGADYVKYEEGNMPLVITIPHGGSKTPSDFPERSIDTNVTASQKYCGYKEEDGDCVYDHQYDSAGACDAHHCEVNYEPESFTEEIGEALVEKLEELAEMKPHLVKLELMKNKLDGNHERELATFGNDKAEAVYDEYMAAINASLEAIKDSEEEGLLLDIHGTSHSHGMLELGYTITRSDLDCGFDCFNVSHMSIAALITRSCGDDEDCAEDILHGEKSLGHFLSAQGYPAMPSPDKTSPDGEKYHHGGYTVHAFGSRNQPEGEIDAIQIEIPEHLRFYPASREVFVEGLASAILDFMEMHYGLVMPEKPHATEEPSCPSAASAVLKPFGIVVGLCCLALLHLFD